MENTSRKRKVRKEESDDEFEYESEAIDWAKKQTLPKGNSPLVVIDNASSSDDDYEGFYIRDNLLLTGLDSSISDQAIVEFFKGFRCNVDSTVSDIKTPTKKNVSVKFRSPKLALEALKQFKDSKLKNENVDLTRAVYSKYQTFCLTGFENLPRAKQIHERSLVNAFVRNNFTKYGKILGLYLPSTTEKIVCYLYLELHPYVKVDEIFCKNLQVRSCQMKGKVSKSLKLPI